MGPRGDWAWIKCLLEEKDVPWEATSREQNRDLVDQNAGYLGDRDKGLEADTGVAGFR